MNVRRLVKVIIPAKLFRRVEPYGHLVEAVLFNLIYGFPARNLKVIGVTGTNGKTSTCFLIHKMLTEAGMRAGLMSTVGYGVGHKIEPQVQHMTNVAVPQLMRRLKQMKAQGADWLVLEATSHGLAQNRLWGIPFSVAVMTNVTHEHLDYHGNFERYRDSKRKLFKLCNRNQKGLKTGVINAEDESAKLFIADISHPVTYGLEAGDLRTQNLKMTPAGSNYETVISGDKYKIKCNLPGKFNVYNSLAAQAVGRAVGLSVKQVEQGIAALESVEGRMTSIDEGQDFEVIVDFAHTPDSFEKLFADLKPVVKGKLIVMFGSAGRRDVTKRSVQGELAGKYCDEVIVTEEDDRDEDRLEILNQIASGAKKSGKVRGKDLFLVHDRTEAIEFSLSRAKAGDTVLLLGKGHEKTIERADGEHLWDEIGITRELLKKTKVLR
ncbi:MAG: UDP-N-acetylmuramoyl-L-alanyl-D-glutamate--2,6-diaminopimelate ligase [Candidatus Saccharimonadales bacterium]